jgi:hypothetical protein
MDSVKISPRFLAFALVSVLGLSLGYVLEPSFNVRAADEVSPSEARAIAKEAYIYGYPMVDHYKVMFAYYLYPNNPEYKGSLNAVYNTARVFTPDDKAIQTPNSDTPYSFVFFDLRAEPYVLTMPPIEKNRYYSAMFVDMYTHNFAYAGTRTTGNGGGKFLVAGPDWKGETPKGITKVIQSETQFVFLGIRTQLFNPADLEKIKKIQAQYKVEPLSAFVHQPLAAPPPKVDWPPYSPEKVKTLAFFNYLNFLLQFCPPHRSETELYARMAKIGVEAGKPFNPDALSPEIRTAMEAGMTAGLKAINDEAAKTTSAEDLFGTREYLENDYLSRAVGAKLGIYGNSKEEAYYFKFTEDADSQPVDASKNNYTLHFAKGQLPPVNAFWSLTMYDGKNSLLVANPLNRYLINSPMLLTLKRDADGGLTIYVQKNSPGKAKESNWLPAYDGPFYAYLRCYYPKEEVLNGSWKPPVLEKAKS